LTTATRYGGQKRKGATSSKDDASAAPSEPAPKRKKVKVLTHRPRFIEPATVPEFVGETSSATEAKEPALAQKTEELTAAPKVEKNWRAESWRDKNIRNFKSFGRSWSAKNPERSSNDPKRKRMVNVLDVLETIKSWSSTPRKIAETPKTQIGTTACEAEAAQRQAETKAGPSEPAKEKSLETREKETEAAEQILDEKTATATPEAFPEALNYILWHASGKKLTEKEKREAQFYAQKLKYPKGALIFNGSGEEDFLYCLQDSKEIFVCREMSKSFRIPMLSKDELADTLAYNSLKVRKWILLKSKIFPFAYT
jgi:hypothetical protein